MNILFIMSDQHHPLVTGYRGHPQVRTPHLDRLPRDGERPTLFDLAVDPREMHDVAADPAYPPAGRPAMNACCPSATLNRRAAGQKSSSD